MSNKITSLYIDDTSIRVMVTIGKRITKLCVAPLDVPLTEVNARDKADEISSKIKQLFKSQKIKTKKVIVGISGLHCLSRPVVLPQLPRAMLEEAVIREAKRVMPVSIEQLYISWNVVSAAEGKMQVFMVALPRQIADTLIGILHNAGLKPYMMDIKPLALSRLVKENAAIIVDVQSKEFDIVVMVEGVPQPIRTVYFPQEASSLPEKLSIVKDELERTVQFYNSNNPERPLQTDITVFVSGELAENPELYESMGSELGYRVLPLTSPLKYPKQLNPAHYLVNVGLVLKELRKEAGPLLANINTLPVPYLPKQISITKIIFLPATAVAIGLIVMLAINIQHAAASNDEVKSKLEATSFILDQRQTQKKELTGGITASEKKVAGAEATRTVFVNALNIINQRGDIINGDLVAAVNNNVGGISLTNIAHSGQDLKISGEAPSEAEILQYARNLRASGRFFKVTIAGIRKVEDSAQETGVAEAPTEGEQAGGEGGAAGIANPAGGVMDFNLVLTLKGSK